MNVELRLTVEAVQAHDVISVAGQTEKVMSVTVLHNGRRLHTVSGNHLTLCAGREMTVLRRVLTSPGRVDQPTADAPAGQLTRRY
ncbi:hypothetical protein ACWGIB_23610 [Streptomyces xiamenensis]